ncbi:MAG: hypothetical protein WCK47_05485 [bacterium]
MRSFTKILSTMVICASLAGAAAAIQIDGFNYADDAAAQAEWIQGGDWNSAGNVGDKSSTVTASLTDKVEGISALKIDYTYTANFYYFVGYFKTYSEPLDLSAAKKFTIWVKTGDNTAADLWFIMKLVSGNGQNFRYVSWNFTFPGGNTWTKLELPLSLQGHDGWSPHNPFDNVDMKDIRNISISLMKSDGNTNPGNTSLLLDDLQYETSASSGETVLEDFNSYADTDALLATWVPFGPAGVLDISLSTTTSVEGKSMACKFDNAALWTRYGAIRTFDAPVDLSTAGYLEVWAYAPTTQDPNTALFLYFEDATVNRARVYMSSFKKAGVWACYNFVPVVAPALAPAGKGDADGFYSEYEDMNNWDSAVAVWHQDKWDAGMLVDIDWTQIKKIQLSIDPLAADDTGVYYIDKITFGNTPSAVSDWSIY